LDTHNNHGAAIKLVKGCVETDQKPIDKLRIKHFARQELET